MQIMDVKDARDIPAPILNRSGIPSISKPSFPEAVRKHVDLFHVFSSFLSAFFRCKWMFFESGYWQEVDADGSGEAASIWMWGS